jgi:NADH-quinone oxidoreductase subunit L
VAIIGAVTLLLAGFSALTQRDIKRVLAYSTISQVGYMFLALGVGAWSAAIFHLMSHAFFKSLLFLAAGVVIQALHEEHDLFNLGGLRKALPLTFWVFLIGSLALAGLPPTAGFASKGLILTQTWSSSLSNRWLYAAGLLGVFLTSIYTFRMLFLAFFGSTKHEILNRPGRTVSVPLILLALLAVLAAGLNWPGSWGGVPWLITFLQGALPASHTAHGGATSSEAWLEIVSVCVSLLGVPVAWLLTVGATSSIRRFTLTRPAAALQRFWLAGWGFDWLYDRLFVRPFVWLARISKNDVIDYFYRAIAGLTEIFHHLLKLTQTGRVRWYATVVAFGAVIIVALVLLL